MTQTPRSTSVRAKEALSFLEQLIWLLDSKGRKVDVKFLKELISDYAQRSEMERELSPSARHLARGYGVAKDADKQYLVGVLPELLQNVNLFPSNKDISDFADQFLLIEITRYEKRSRYEMIGLVVCKVNELSKNSVLRLTKRLSALLTDEELLKSIEVEKSSNSLFTWNDVIRRIGS